MGSAEQVAAAAEPLAALLELRCRLPRQRGLRDTSVRWYMVKECLPLCFKGHDGIFI